VGAPLSPVALAPVVSPIVLAPPLPFAPAKPSAVVLALPAPVGFVLVVSPVGSVTFSRVVQPLLVSPLVSTPLLSPFVSAPLLSPFVSALPSLFLFAPLSPVVQALVSPPVSVSSEPMPPLPPVSPLADSVHPNMNNNSLHPPSPQPPVVISQVQHPVSPLPLNIRNIPHQLPLLPVSHSLSFPLSSVSAVHQSNTPPHLSLK
jgi:hypothetical protein